MRTKSKGNLEQPDVQETEVEVTANIHMDEVLEEFLLRTRRVLVVGEISELSSIHVCCQLQLYSMRKEPVYMYINSPGGCLAAGYAIVDQMLLCDCPIYTVVRGQAYSMGAIIAAFGQKGHRYITPNSSMMLHSVLIHGPQESIERHAKMMEHIQGDYDQKIDALARRLKITKKQLINTMDSTKWMCAKQAIEIGLVDGLWTPKMEKDVNGSFS